MEITLHFLDGQLLQVFTCGNPEYFGQNPLPAMRFANDACYRIVTDVWTGQHGIKANETHREPVRGWAVAPCQGCGHTHYNYPPDLKVLNLTLVGDPENPKHES